MVRRIVALAVLVAVSFMPAPANAGLTEEPTVLYPLSASDDGIYHVQIEGPSNIWSMRYAAWDIEDLLPSVDIKALGTCEDIPEDWTCLRVEVGDFGESGWNGLFTYDEPYDGLHRNIKLNEYYVSEAWMSKWNAWENRRARNYVAAHELMHALGLTHHAAPGLLHYPKQTYPLPTRPSEEEVAALNAYYGD